MAEPATFRNFFEAVKGEIYARVGLFDAEFFLEKAAPKCEEEMPLPLTEELVLAFAEAAADYFSDVLSATRTDDFRNTFVRQYSAFFGIVRCAAQRFGFNIPLERLDPSFESLEEDLETAREAGIDEP